VGNQLETSYPATRRRIGLELAVFLALYGVWISQNLLGNPFRPWLFGLAAVMAALYVATYALLYSGIHRRWGMGKPNLPDVTISGSLLLLLLLASIPIAVGGFFLRDQGSLPRIMAGPLYLPWCLVQDFIFFSFVLVHLEAVLGRPWLAAFLTAGLFGASHLPFVGLAIVTGMSGLLWAWIFIRTRSLLAVVVAHVLTGGALLL